jgi:cation transport ATPase
LDEVLQDKENNMSLNRFLTVFSRIAAYILIVLFVIIMITGYRSTGHFTFMTRGLANTLHIIYLNIAFLVLACIHALISIRFALARKNVKGHYVDVLLLIIGAVFIAGFAYFAF